MQILLMLLIVSYVLIPFINADLFTARFTVPDNNPRHSSIGNIISKLPPQFPRATYQIITRKSSYSKFNQYFRIYDNGELKITRDFDRDDVNNVCGPLGCCDKPSCEISLDIIITITPKNERIPVKVIIVIEDENDNAPSFMENSFSISINENDDSQFYHSLPIALDRDSPMYGIKNYSLSGEKVEYFSTKMRNSQLFLFARRSFDFEKPTEKQFKLLVLAVDNGGKNATLQLTINIIDINDNQPAFNEKLVNLSIQENTTFSNPILILNATDLDSGNNAKISYIFSTINLPVIKETFQLQSETGRIYLTKALDYELYSEQKFDINVLAIDHGSPQLSDSCVIRINVTDINDNSPVIEIVYNAPIPENEQTLEPVLKLYANDYDSIDNEVKCIANQFDNKLKLEQVEKASYFIYATGSYDYEKEKNLTVSIICQDSGKPPRFTNQLLTIHIKDVNDNRPKFLKSFYRTSISENYQINKTFIRIQAVDKDSDDFGKVKYSVGLKDQKYFSVDEISGDVKLLTAVDRESKDFFNVSIIATDGGGLKDFTFIEIIVTDVNDNFPQLKSGQSMSINENFPVESIVGYISVIDLDLGDNGKVEWTYELFENSSSVLRIDNCTVFTSAILDRESVDYLYILITMVDMGFPQLTSSTTITVSIIDENDNVPQILYPRIGSLIEDNEMNYLAVNSPKYTSVLLIKSYDPDYGINGDVLYHILPSNGSRFFIINETSGVLKTIWVYDTISFTPLHPREDIYKISFAAYNQVKSSKNLSSSTSSFFYIRIGPYRHFINNEVFYKYHKRPFFNNIVLLILIGGFTISLSAALIAAIIWAKSKYSTESTSLEQAQANDGKFMMLMMSGEMQNTNNTYVYDPYSSLIVDADRTIDSGYALSHSRSSTFNSRHNVRDHALLNGFETKTMPRSMIQSNMMHQYLSDPQDNQGNSLSTTDLVNCSTSGSVRHHKPINKLKHEISKEKKDTDISETFYRHFEHDQQCASPMINKVNRHRSFDQQYGSISPRAASICDPTPTTVSGSHWVPKDMAADNGSNSYTVC